MSSFTRTTMLGRRVLVDDWRGFHRDWLLAVLYGMRDRRGDGAELSIPDISSAIGLDVSKVCELVNSMKATIHNGIEITPRGIRWVEESPVQP
jgi:hypothetical protein